MGKLIYDSNLVTDFEDRLLAHLQIVIGAKLRRGESFAFGWRDSEGVGNGRTLIWVHPALPLRYKYSGATMPAINREWIELLTTAINSPSGLEALPEPSVETKEQL